MSDTTLPEELSRSGRICVLIAAFSGLVFDGFELGLMPVASQSVTASLVGSAFTKTLGGNWFAWYMASLMLGAAIGGIVLGSLGDRVGRTRAMGISILFYSLFAGMGGWVTTQEQMLVLRFLVGLGVGGMWPNGVALVAECWPNTSRPLVSGILGAGINVGILFLSQLTRIWPVTADSWRWIFQLSALPALLGVVVLIALPESPKWLATRGPSKKSNVPWREFTRPPLSQALFVGILLSSIPLIGAWAGSKWMIPWAEEVAGKVQTGYKSITQGWWALGATLGSFSGAQIAGLLGRQRSYFLISLGTTILTIALFQWTAPLEPSFLPIVFAQGFVSTLFFGWLPLYLPELFPTAVRATGTGVAMNTGRFVTAGGVLLAGTLFVLLGGKYPAVGTVVGLFYGLGMITIWFAPETAGRSLDSK
ncbi:MFS transporter [Schlesneria paludicola]|uniref:MFS transporter n=1 Tax=Schlesneria paludicola TaxID=360056 RepID=UPI000299EFBE|nr:MFS transporter [Schlesneria paludicola]